jgi:hypothetical protein
MLQIREPIHVSVHFICIYFYLKNQRTAFLSRSTVPYTPRNVKMLQEIHSIHIVSTETCCVPACVAVAPTGTFTPFRNSEVQNGTAQRMTASKASDRCRQDELDAADKTNPL